MTPILQAAGCYARRDAAIRTVIPDYRPGYKSKIVLPIAPKAPKRERVSISIGGTHE